MIRLAANNKFAQHEVFNFPVGEMHLRIKETGLCGVHDIFFDFERNDEILELLLLVDTIRNVNKHIGPINLFMPYVPFSRQDRSNESGECFSLRVFAKLINGCGFNKVFIKDPHSDVTAALIDRCIVTTQDEIFQVNFLDKEDFWLISPDAGALKKVNKLYAKLPKCLGVVECSKRRNTVTGKITDTIIHADDLAWKDCYVLDDIADGGSTFIGIAKALKAKRAGKIILMVTHGFFTKGLSVFDGLIDEIYTLRGKIK